MKEKIIGIIGLCLFLLILTPYVKASVSCHKEYYINGTAYINDTCVLNDEELEKDLYGNATGSGPKDMVLEDILDRDSNSSSSQNSSQVSAQSEEENLEEMKDICDDPEIQEYFTNFGSIPPEGFVEYVKSLGYDDEAHINFIWTLCQEEKLKEMNEYIGENEGKWSMDEKGISTSTVASLIQRAIDWLLGKNSHPSDTEKRIATNLDSYFASDRDTYYLLLRIRDLEFRVESLENAMNEIAADEYCRGKLEVLVKYNLTGVSCGNTYYHNHMKSSNGEDIIIGITPANEEEVKVNEFIAENESSMNENKTQLFPSEDHKLLEMKSLNQSSDEGLNNPKWIDLNTDALVKVSLLFFSFFVIIFVIYKNLGRISLEFGILKLIKGKYAYRYGKGWGKIRF